MVGLGVMLEFIEHLVNPGLITSCLPGESGEHLIGHLAYHPVSHVVLWWVCRIQMDECTFIWAL